MRAPGRMPARWHAAAAPPPSALGLTQERMSMKIVLRILQVLLALGVIVVVIAAVKGG